MSRLLKQMRLHGKYRLGDVVKSPFISACELVVDKFIDRTGKITYGMMYIEGPGDGAYSNVRLTAEEMSEGRLQYTTLYNVFDKRRTN